MSDSINENLTNFINKTKEIMFENDLEDIYIERLQRKLTELYGNDLYEITINKNKLRRSNNEKD